MVSETERQRDERARERAKESERERERESVLVERETETETERQSAIKRQREREEPFSGSVSRVPLRFGSARFGCCGSGSAVPVRFHGLPVVTILVILISY